MDIVGVGGWIPVKATEEAHLTAMRLDKTKRENPDHCPYSYGNCHLVGEAQASILMVCI